MAKRRKADKVATPPSEATARSQVEGFSISGSERTVYTPTNALVKSASLAIVLHFAAILISLASNYAPSYLQGEVMDWLSPYLVTTHQSYGAMPLEFTHGQAVDFPVAIEVQREGVEQWDALELGNPGSDPMRSRWLSMGRIITIIAMDQPDSEILAELANQIVTYSEAVSTGRQAKIRSVRLVQPHVLTFDEDAVVASGGKSILEQEFAPESLYAAGVVRVDGRAIGLLPFQDESRTSRTLDVDETGQ